jgi:hypothetical protein
MGVGGDFEDFLRGKGRITCRGVHAGGLGLLMTTVIGEGAHADVWLGLFMTES